VDIDPRIIDISRKLHNYFCDIGLTNNVINNFSYKTLIRINHLGETCKSNNLKPLIKQIAGKRTNLLFRNLQIGAIIHPR
jgi:hypothetical protein